MLKGQCLCGAVKIEADHHSRDIGVCHCKMCQRWTGLAFAGIAVPGESIRVIGDHSTYQSSATSTRSFCSICGSTLWFRTIGEPDYEVAIGLLDSAELRLDHEIYVDRKSPAWSMAGDHPKRTECDVQAKIDASGGP